MINAKMEQSEHISLTAGPIPLTASAPPPSTFTPLTLAVPLSDALRPGPPGSQSDVLFDALDLDTASAGTLIACTHARTQTHKHTMCASFITVVYSCMRIRGYACARRHMYTHI